MKFYFKKFSFDTMLDECPMCGYPCDVFEAHCPYCGFIPFDEESGDQFVEFDLAYFDCNTLEHIL